MSLTPIHRIQGSGLNSPLAGRSVRTRGVVTGRTHRGFFIQDPDGGGREHGASDGLFVFARRTRPPVGALVEVSGGVLDYLPTPDERPTTQLVLEDAPRVLAEGGAVPEPTWLTARALDVPMPKLTEFLNAHEGMVCGVRAGATFVAPSNPFGDYLVLPADVEATRTKFDGVLIDPRDLHRWYPSFRVLDYDKAPRVDVGARLTTDVFGPLNYRAAAFQIVATGAVGVEPADVKPQLGRLASGGDRTTVLTLNGFNLDPKIEAAALVQDPRRDIDDDVGDGRFRMLARAVAEHACGPDVVALQEVQDNDGAEITDVTAADRTLTRFARRIHDVGGPRYRWADAAPAAGADGGQPGGNIRNAFLYNPERLQLVADGVRRLGEDDPAFDDSRKPVLAVFQRHGSRQQLAVINVHLASKRHQFSVFAPERPGYDPRLEVRIRQAESIRRTVAELEKAGVETYVTGDFNDFEFSDTLAALVADDRANLVEGVPHESRFDYNHRGISQALMHGVVSTRFAAERGAEYEILHGNDLVGVQPGTMGGKATDHAYVLARLGV